MSKFCAKLLSKLFLFVLIQKDRDKEVLTTQNQLMVKATADQVTKTKKLKWITVNLKRFQLHQRANANSSNQVFSYVMKWF